MLQDFGDEKRRLGIVQTAQMDVKEYSYFAGNQWRKAADNQVFEVHEPCACWRSAPGAF